MIEVCPGLHVGNAIDWEKHVKGSDGQPREGWSVVHAAKEPWHREVLKYGSRAAPKDHPEYLVARRDNRLILNIVDVDDHKYIARDMIDAALDFISEELSAGRKVLCHCNQGHSRSPSIALLYMARSGLTSKVKDDAIKSFTKLYPLYAPAKGISDFVSLNWSAYHAP